MSKGIIFKNASNEKIYPCPYYPIGSIYLSLNNTNPSTYFGGTWEQLKDRFLLGAGNTYSSGATGGEANHTLSTSELPNHSHSFTTGSGGYHDHQVALNGDSNFNIYYRLSWGSTNTGYCISGNNTGGQSSGASYPSIAKGSGTHNHTGTTDGSGSNSSHNNMPPYLVVFMWKRIS